MAIGCVLFCPLQGYLSNLAMKYQEEKSMKAKMIKVTATVANGILCVVQAVGTNLLASVLLA